MGNLTQPFPQYWSLATTEPDDWLAVRIRNVTAGEADFKHSASFLTPPRDYMMVGVPNAHTKFSVSLDFLYQNTPLQEIWRAAAAFFKDGSVFFFIWLA